MKFDICLCKRCYGRVLAQGTYDSIPEEELNISIDEYDCDACRNDSREYLRNNEYIKADKYIMVQTRCGYYAIGTSTSFTQDIAKASKFTNFDRVKELSDRLVMSVYKLVNRDGGNTKFEFVYRGKAKYVNIEQSLTAMK